MIGCLRGIPAITAIGIPSTVTRHIAIITRIATTIQIAIITHITTTITTHIVIITRIATTIHTSITATVRIANRI
jgi:hypothetical protein